MWFLLREGDFKVPCEEQLIVLEYYPRQAAGSHSAVKHYHEWNISLRPTSRRESFAHHQLADHLFGFPHIDSAARVSEFESDSTFFLFISF